MPKVLSAEKIARYERDGAIAPIPIMSCEDAKALRMRFEGLESGIDGEMSIHHNNIHSSEPNPSDQSRIGFAVHIAPPQVRQEQFDDPTAVVVGGSDRFGHWESEPTPRGDMDSDCLAILNQAWD